MITAGTHFSYPLFNRAWSAALAAAAPDVILPRHLPPVPAGRLVIIAAGKAAAAMAAAALNHYRNSGTPLSGVVVAPAAPAGPLGTLEVHVGAHPVPDESGVRAGRAVLDHVTALSVDDHVLCLLSGGASALMTVPDGIALPELQELNRALLASGADIGALNTVRRKLCRLKGGGLARAAAPAQVTALLLSDVVGDDPAMIASGPAVADPDSASDALQVLAGLGIDIPAVTARLRELAASGDRTDQSAVNAQNTVVGSGSASLSAAAGVFEAAGYPAHILAAGITGDSAGAAGFHAAIARETLDSARPFATPCVLLSGGETTVAVDSTHTGGRGGPNSQFALALACELWNEPAAAALVADTDGIDGNSPAAGAYLTSGLHAGTSLNRARVALDNRDSGGFMHAHGHSFVTGPTGTNVNDLRMILLEKP